MACAVQIPKYGRLRTEPKVYCEIETSARLDLTVNFHHGHFIDSTNCPWVSEDEKYTKFIQFCFKFKQEKTWTIVNGSCVKLFYTTKPSGHHPIRVLFSLYKMMTKFC